jgi:diguanylate cyclase (GGDEF)-like protein/PAS domain S-box-containing protein
MWQGTVTYQRADASTFPAQVSAVLLPDASGQPSAIGVIVRDITEAMQREATLRASQEALSASEARYRAISELISDYAYAYRVEPDGTTVWEWITESSARVIGLTPQEIMQGADWSQAIYAPDQHLVHYSYEQALAGKATSIEFRLVNTGPTMRWLHTYTQPVWDADANRVVRIYGAVQDITERKRSEAALREANEQLTLWVHQLEQRNREITLLNEMGDFLQICLTVEEAYQVVEQFAHQLFAEYGGALYMLNPSRTVAEAVASWGDPPPAELVFSSDACWALRAGRAHVLQNPYLGLRCKHMQRHASQPYMCVPLIAQGETLGMLHLRTAHSSQHQASEHWEWLAVMVSGHLALALANLQLRERLRNQSIRDPLTGVFNRRYMEESLEREMRRASRHGHPVGVIMLDIDHFKRFNDTHGHEAGDTLLRALGSVLQKRMRGEDIVCRYGGEEFTIIMPEASLHDTQRRAEEVRADCKNLQIQYNNQSLGLISISLGVACFPEHGRTGTEVLRLADNALYLAKTRGRDCVALAGQ